MVVACIALAVALSGASYAANTAPTAVKGKQAQATSSKTIRGPRGPRGPRGFAGPAGPDPEPYLKLIRDYEQAGFTHVYIHQIGHNQDEFIEFARRELLPNV